MGRRFRSGRCPGATRCQLCPPCTVVHAFEHVRASQVKILRLLDCSGVIEQSIAWGSHRLLMLLLVRQPRSRKQSSLPSILIT